jgi:hypothetical protein
MIKKIFLLFTIGMMIARFGRLQAQVNNECSGALSISFGIPLSSSNTGSTQSQAPNNCNGFATPTPAKDVWFKFTYASGMDSILVDPGPNPNADIVTELFSGSCANLNQISCSNFAEPNSNNQSEGFLLSALGLQEGVTYFFRVYGSAGFETNFTVLLKSASNLPPPANNECSTAQLLNAGQILPGNSIGATQSIPPINCNGFTSSTAKDVWYKFTKTPAVESLILYPESSDLVLQVFTGNCTSLTSIGCSDNEGSGLTEQVSVSTITNGTQCYARVYGRNGTAGNFSIKIFSPPINDNCSTASEMLANVSLNGRTIDATQSAAPSACGGTSDDDVWYYFFMAANMDSVVVTPGMNFSPVIELRSGVCSSSVAVSCQFTGGKVKLPVNTLMEGTRYYIRVYSHSGPTGTFNIRLFQSTGAIPANDQCSNPQVINPGLGINFSASNAGATQSQPAVPCGGDGSTSAADVWYSFVRTAVRDTLVLDGLGSIDLMADIRSACTTDSLVSCIDVGGTGTKPIDLSELSEGKTYLLRVYGRNGAVGNFNLRFKENTFVPQAPANNDCFSAQQLTVSAACTSITGTSISADVTTGLSNPACAVGQAKDVWYKFTANANRAIVRLTCDQGFDGVMEALSGNCFAPVSRGCVNEYPAGEDPDFPVVEELYLTGLTSGQQIFIRVFGNNGATGSFSVCVYNPACSSTAPVLSSASSSIISNQAFTAGLSNAQGLITYQLSETSSFYKFLNTSKNNTLDTLIIASSTGGNFQMRAMSRTAECFPAFSANIPISVRCATPFLAPSPTIFVSQVKITGINNSSSFNSLGGFVQDFSAQTAEVCKGSSYDLSVQCSMADGKLFAWADFNQDGDFVDVGENLINSLPANFTLQNYNISIPATATTGNCRLRVMVVNNSSIVTGNNPCAAGPYITGEIEEYTLNITTCSSIEEWVSKLGFSIYPNPSSGEITVFIPDNIEPPLQITLTDITGKVLWNNNISAESNIIRINQQIPTGIYLIKVSDDKRGIFSTRRLIRK